MKKIRLFALLLVLVMIVGAVAACSETPIEGGEGTTAGENATEGLAGTTMPEETTYPVDEDGYEIDRLPDTLNFNNEEFVIFTWSNQTIWEWNEDDTTNGDKIHDAIYTRQIRTEARLNIDIVIRKQTGDWNNRNTFIAAVEANSSAGTADAFDLVGQYTPAAPIGAMKNLYEDISEAEYLDWDRSWWPADIAESCHINNNVYFITGDITGTLVRNVQAVLCNLSLAEQHQLGDVYKLVNDREWTMDKFMELAVGTIQGLNPDGSTAYSVTFPNNVAYDALFYGAGFRFVEHDKDGKLCMSEDLTGDRLSTWFMTCKSLLMDNQDVEIDKAVNAENGFTSGNVLFHFGSIADVQNSLQNIDFKFAVLPHPMHDKDQDDYYTITSYWVSMYSIPVNAADKAMSGAVLECLGSYGFRIMTPIIYEQAFQYRFLNSLENAQMFDLLHNTLVFDPGRLFADQLNCFAAFREAAKTTSSSWNQYYASNGLTWGLKLEKIINTLG